MKRTKRAWFSVVTALGVVGSMVACSYIAGSGDADKFAEDWSRVNTFGAADVSHQCQTRDTDGNGYVSCTVSVQWERGNPRREMIPIECAVNRVGNGCNVEGCRPLAAFGRPR
jgi:hypothetical protein